MTIKKILMNFRLCCFILFFWTGHGYALDPNEKNCDSLKIRLYSAVVKSMEAEGQFRQTLEQYEKILSEYEQCVSDCSLIIEQLASMLLTLQEKKEQWNTILEQHQQALDRYHNNNCNPELYQQNP